MTRVRTTMSWEGYFVIDGGERVLLTQERLGNNIFYSSRRKVVSASVDEEQVGGKTYERGEDYEYVAGVRSVSEDGTRGPWSHFLVIPSEKRQMSLEEIEERKGTSMEIKDYGSTRIRGMPVVTLPGFTIPVPILSVFHLLGLTTDKDLYDVILAGIPREDRSVYDDLFLQFVLGHKPEKSDLETLKVATKSRSEEEVFFNLQAMLLPTWNPRSQTIREPYFVVRRMDSGTYSVSVWMLPSESRTRRTATIFDSSALMCLAISVFRSSGVSTRMCQKR